MKLDLYTDAGVTRDRIATWAVVAVRRGEPEPLFEASGRLRADTHCSATAECRAIANALHRLIRSGNVTRGDGVRVLTDSRHAADRIAGRLVTSPDGAPARAAAVIRRLAAEHGFHLRSSWIKGHRPDASDVHAQWNNRCDALCRAARTLPRPCPARRALGTARRLSGKAG